MKNPKLLAGVVCVLCASLGFVLGYVVGHNQPEKATERIIVGTVSSMIEGELCIDELSTGKTVCAVPRLNRPTALPLLGDRVTAKLTRLEFEEGLLAEAWLWIV